MRSNSQSSEHDFRTLNSAVPTFEGHSIVQSAHTSLSPTRSVLVVLVQCCRAPAASCLGWTFCSVRLANKGAVCLPQSRAADGVVPKTSLIGKSYIQRSSLQRLVLFYFFPFKTVSYEEIFPGNFRVVGVIRKISSPKISSGKKSSNSPSRGNFQAQNFLETRRNFEIT